MTCAVSPPRKATEAPPLAWERPAVDLERPVTGLSTPRAVVLLSGGLDSATCLAVAQSEGRSCLALSVDYGQRHRVELDAAARVAAAAGVEHVVVGVDLAAIGGSALTDDVPVPHGTAGQAPTGVPVTYVPARNTVLLSLALGLAEVRDATEVWIGVNAVDYSGYPDCRPAFIEAFQSLADVATAAATEEGRRTVIRAPLLELSKAGIIGLGTSLGVDYALTSSCYDPVGTRPCGTCDSCRIRLAGFAAAGISDPLGDGTPAEPAAPGGSA
jgi:7-cyano-7-deazaguanine synthase